MQFRKSASWLSGLLIIAAIAGCSGDKGTNSPEKSEPPAFEVRTISVPQKMIQSQDPMARMAVVYINMANAISNYISFLSPPASAKKLARPVSVQGWTYTWTEGSLAVTLKISETGDKYIWEVFLKGTDGKFTYDNWKSLHSERTKDGNSGLMIVYEPVTTNPAMKWTWEVDPETEAYNFVMTTFGDGGGKIEIVSNPDGSGSLASYEGADGNYVLKFRVEWGSDGSGHWWTYENGNVASEGSWS